MPVPDTCGLPSCDMQDIVFAGDDVLTLPKPSEKFDELLTR